MTTKKFVLPQLYFSKLMRAITEFELIGEGDKILLGISGGKDSIFMAYAMAMMQKRLKKNFQLHTSRRAYPILPGVC